MAEPSLKLPTKPTVTYVFRTARKGEPVFSDVTLPDGTIVRSVDKDVHERALRRVAANYRDRAE